MNKQEIKIYNLVMVYPKILRNKQVLLDYNIFMYVTLASPCFMYNMYRVVDVFKYSFQSLLLSKVNTL